MSATFITDEDVDLSVNDKLKVIMDSFRNRYGRKPDFVSRSPGRVNLIGDHIDYEDFSVLPMAIELGVLCAVKCVDDQQTAVIKLSNSDSTFGDRTVELPPDGDLVTIDPAVSDWSNYFKCGLLVAQQHLKRLFPDRFSTSALKGMEVFVTGDVPAGLSSSAAFICAVALAVIRANLGRDHQIPKQDLMNITVVAEHYVGVNNGGMDQAASVCGETDHALYVQFRPELKATAFMFPKLDHSEVNFIVANTLKVSNKVETAPTHYNLRVLEVTLAANVLAKNYGVELPSDGNMKKGTLRSFMDAYWQKFHGATSPWEGDIDSGITRMNAMLGLVESCFGDRKSLGVVDVAASLGCTSDELKKDFLSHFPVRFETLRLYQRSKHVYSEAIRVLEALKILTAKTFDSDEAFFSSFGALMNESQQSCDVLYECSCAETDEICRIARASGASGSRLTGAGWGGCTVHLVPSSKVNDVKRTH
ncbi:LAMI_0D13432g1_1 [Lachancea mirantina]|uniref:LAMI_0D13432g1_1 n=1 Tax=Lachancea mirantina TaxID=1230905 RepID=A0A1G4JGS6_9SACH|nr:LAMI_0D13432g1_1 [Lachancea mirantina]